MTPRRAFLALSLVAFAASAAAASPSQSTSLPVDPAAIAFDASADHDAEDSNGPKLLKYVIEFVPLVGAEGTAYTLDLGKPKPVQGQITVRLAKVLLPGTYLAHVRATGRGVKSAATTTGPFVITEKTGRTKAEFDKEMRERKQSEEQDGKNKKPKPPRDSADPPAKGGFWKKFYEKVVG